jgi:hypothetical protein
MKNSNSNTLAKYISDMLAVEQHFIETLKIEEYDDQLKRFPEAKQEILRLRAMTEEHMSALDTLLRDFDGAGRSVLKEMVTSVTGVTMGAAARLRKHSTSKILRDAYATLSLHAIGYTMLHTTGLALGSPPTAELALAHLKNITAMIIEISHSIVPVVAAELSEDHLIDASSVVLAIENTQEAWRHPDPVAAY